MVKGGRLKETYLKKISLRNDSVFVPYIYIFLSLSLLEEKILFFMKKKT